MPEDQRGSLVEELVRLYQEERDAGIHGAAEWTLRQWGQGDRLNTADRELAGTEPRGGRRWYINRHGQTFSVIDGPDEFPMGAPATDVERNGSIEDPHRMAIPRRYAIAMKEVTVAQLREFLKTHGEHKMERSIVRHSPVADGPWIGATWYAAAAYCNWLSEKEGLPEEEWCYRPNPSGMYAEGMVIPADALKRTGYRLPTEAEWEYACRAGAVTSRYYGSSPELLGRYAWYQANSGNRAHPCGSLLPNDFGLFDMLGNVFEWCQDRNASYRPSRKGLFIDDLSIDEFVSDGRVRICRGGAFATPAEEARASARAGDQPLFSSYMNGFRVARTLKPDQ